MHFRITSSFQRYILIFKWKALHYNSYNNFFSFTFSLYFPFQFLLHYLSVPMQANQERDRQRVCEAERERKKEKDCIKWEVKKLWRMLTPSKEKSQVPLGQDQGQGCRELPGCLLSSHILRPLSYYWSRATEDKLNFQDKYSRRGNLVMSGMPPCRNSWCPGAKAAWGHTGISAVCGCPAPMFRIKGTSRCLWQKCITE